MRLSRTDVLSEIRMIYAASREILEETGVKIYNKDALEIFRKNGAVINTEKMIARILQKMIGRALGTLPVSFRLLNRDKDSSFDLGGESSYCASRHNAIYIFDEAQMERRPVTKEEVGKFVLIADDLPKIHLTDIQAMPQDVLPKASIHHALDAFFNNTSKNIFFSPENIDETRSLLQMIRVVSEEELPGSDINNYDCDKKYKKHFKYNKRTSSYKP